jgi:hypothetical protein
MLRYKNKTFKIMLVGDPHITANEKSERDKSSFRDYIRFQRAALDNIKPDLVVLMGDNLSADNANDFKKTLDKMVEPYIDACVPFTAVYGNHDFEHKFNNREEMDKIYKSYDLSYFLKSEYTNEYGDYVLPIYSGNSISNLIFCMYSGNRCENQEVSKYAYILPEQIAWYEKTSKEISEKCGKEIHSIVIQHIPVCEEFELCKKVSAIRRLADGVPGLSLNKDDTYVLDRKTGVKGYMGEAPCTPDYNSGQFASWKKMGNIMGAFFGHDHMNDFVGYVDDIMLAQCKTASFRVYGDGLRQGVRVVELLDGYDKIYNSYMLRYRDIFGTENETIHGSELIPDRITKFFDKDERRDLCSILLSVLQNPGKQQKSETS